MDVSESSQKDRGISAAAFSEVPRLGSEDQLPTKKTHHGRAAFPGEKRKSAKSGPTRERHSFESDQPQYSSSRLMGRNVPDNGFGRCDGHHESVDLRLGKMTRPIQQVPLERKPRTCRGFKDHEESRDQGALDALILSQGRNQAKRGSRKRPDPPRLGKAGRGVPRRTRGASSVGGTSREVPPAGFHLSWAVSTYRTPRRSSLSHFLDNTTLHFFGQRFPFFGRRISRSCVVCALG